MANEQSSRSDEVPQGEVRWLIEGKKYYPTRTVFWSGAWWTEDALLAARYPSKEAADGARVRDPMTDAHFIESVEHVFQCGTTVSERGSIERDAETLRLIEHHRIRLQWWPTSDSEMWSADAAGNRYVATDKSLDVAVRACVAAIPGKRPKGSEG